MITVISRFRVANRKSAQVAQAFRERPHLVEKAAGFRGMEVLRGVADPSIFCLYTQWDDLDSYRSWHASPAHQASHVGIPKGLKLDAAYTKVEILYDDDPAGDKTPGAVLSRFLSGSRQTYFLRLDQKGEIQSCSPGFCNALGILPKALVGKNLSELLVEPDAQSLRKRLKSSPGGEEFILNFVDGNLLPFSARARLLIQGNGAVLIAERDMTDEGNLHRELIGLNNELAVLTRENQQKNRELMRVKDELTRAIEERDKSFWYIRKIHEVLPICMMCHKVKSSPKSWESLNDFFQKNTDFLTHGYCPGCLRKLKVKKQ